MPLGSQPKKELTSASLFITLSMAYHHEWSQSYIKGLTFEEHHVNNEWFNNMLTMLKDDGVLYVPCLDKSFNKSGEEVNTNFDKSEDKVGVHKLEPISYYDHRIKEEINNENR